MDAQPHSSDLRLARSAFKAVHFSESAANAMQMGITHSGMQHPAAQHSRSTCLTLQGLHCGNRRCGGGPTGSFSIARARRSACRCRASAKASARSSVRCLLLCCTPLCRRD